MPYFAIHPESVADVSSEQARGEFEKMRARISKNMNIPAEDIVYDDKYYSDSVPKGTTKLSEITDKGEKPS
jgi:hypothetical protein